MGKKKKGRGRGGVSARRRRWRGARARGGVRGRVRGPGEAAARAAGDNRGRRSRVHGMGRRRGKRESEVRLKKENVESTNGIGCWKSGVRDKEKISGIRVQGFRRILSSMMSGIFKNIFLVRDLFWWIFGMLQAGTTVGFGGEARARAHWSRQGVP